jgi:xanthine dehydrogenase molybdopterin-binding subunit B
MTPVKYGVSARYQQIYLTVYEDGTIQLNHGGVEVGQGIHTKVIQGATFALSRFAVTGVSMGLFVVEETNTSVIPNAAMTGGSTTSEAAVAGTMNAIEQLIERLEPVRAAIVKEKLAKLAKAKENGADADSAKSTDGKDGEQSESAAAAGEKKTSAADEQDLPAVSWLEVVQKALSDNIPLAIQSAFRRMPGAISSPADIAPLKYFNFGACASEVEIDVQTGEVIILRSDMVYDCGTSLNPAIDLGQAEGGFVQGLGFYLTEDLLEDEQGRISSDGTWEYKPPLMTDIPLHFNVEFMRGIDKGKGILSSKASGEPPLVLSTSVYAAVTNAVAAARKGAGLRPRTTYHAPITVEQVAMACKSAP